MVRLLALLGALALAAISSTASAQKTASPPAARGLDLALAIEAAQTAIDACSAKGFKIGATIVDASGAPKVLLAADGAGPKAVETGRQKATTVIALKASTADVVEKMKTDPALAAKIHDDPTLFVHAGGLLLMAGNDIIGAFGVGGVSGSGGGGLGDEACAKAGLDKIKARLK
jgi:uncharacterized protein GlcG (DUF336 family)